MFFFANNWLARLIAFVFAVGLIITIAIKVTKRPKIVKKNNFMGVDMPFGEFMGLISDPGGA